MQRYSFLRTRNAAASPPRSTDLSPAKTKRNEEKRREREKEREETGNDDGGAVVTWSERARASWPARGKAAVARPRRDKAEACTFWAE